jgi:hypothetical protein
MPAQSEGDQSSDQPNFPLTPSKTPPAVPPSLSIFASLRKAEITSPGQRGSAARDRSAVALSFLRPVLLFVAVTMA